MWQLKVLFFKNIINFYFLKIYFERLTSDISRLSILNYFPLARSLQVIHLQKYFCAVYIDAGKPCLRGFAKNKGADQTAHSHRLISAIIIRFLERIIS